MWHAFLSFSIALIQITVCFYWFHLLHVVVFIIAVILLATSFLVYLPYCKSRHCGFFFYFASPFSRQTWVFFLRLTPTPKTTNNIRFEAPRMEFYKKGKKIWNKKLQTQQTKRTVYVFVNIYPYEFAFIWSLYWFRNTKIVSEKLDSSLHFISWLVTIVLCCPDIHDIHNITIFIEFGL